MIGRSAETAGFNFFTAAELGVEMGENIQDEALLRKGPKRAAWKCFT